MAVRNGTAKIAKRYDMVIPPSSPKGNANMSRTGAEPKERPSAADVQPADLRL